VYELFVKGVTLPEAYHNALYELYRYHQVVPCPDYGTSQMEASMTFVVEEPLREPMISKLFIGDPVSLEQYRQEMLDGILDFEVARGNWEYTYHQRMEKQIPWILGELRRNPDTRRAVIGIRTEEDLASGSPACLQTIQFFLREGKLHEKVLFRSNDAPEAAFMNAFALIFMQKKIADALGVPVGSYTHRANSFHVYEKDYGMFSGYIRRIENSASVEDLTYRYAGGWDELMEAAGPEIAAKVARERAKGEGSAGE
jgi:thymidylate synthase